MPANYFDQLTAPAVQEFLDAHVNDDIGELLLRYKEVAGVPVTLIVNQVAGRRKAKSKLPLLAANPKIIYPPSLNLEQCSSQATASYKASLFTGKTLADLTGGFGIDALFFGHTFEHVHYIEPDASLMEIARHNHRALGQMNIEYHVADASGFLKSAGRFDLLYLDPSRRREGKKVHSLKDYTPDAAALLSGLLEHTRRVLIKTSPMLDIREGIRSLKKVQTIHVVAVENECREILFHCAHGSTADPAIMAVDLSITGEILSSFSFRISEEKNAMVHFSEPGRYLYEPNAALMKAGAFRLAASRFGLKKIAPHTHLYVSEDFVTGFPGRVFKLLGRAKADARSVAGLLPERKANVVVRNYPLSAAALAKKLHLADGGEKYVLAFSGVAEKYLMIGERVR